MDGAVGVANAGVVWAESAGPLLPAGNAIIVAWTRISGIYGINRILKNSLIPEIWVQIALLIKLLIIY